MASDSPSSDIVLRVNPKAQTATKAAITETGRARPVITVERQELRKRNTTSTVSSAPSTSAFSTSSTERSTRSPASRTTLMSTPAGSVGRSSSTFALMRFATSAVRVALGLDDVEADGLLAVEEGERARLLGAVDGAANVAEADQTPTARGHDQLVEVAGVGEPPGEADGPLREGVGQPPHRRRQVLRLHRPHHLGDADAGGLQPLRLQLDGHLALDCPQPHVGDAGDAAQLRVTRPGSATG